MSSFPPDSSAASAAPPELSLALESVVTRFATLVRRVGWKHGLDGDDLDEVMQDVRLRLWRARGDSEQIRASSASYVYRTATSAALDLLRRRRRLAGWTDTGTAALMESADDVEMVHAPVAAGDDPEHTLAASEVARAVETAVSRITKSRRPVVRMHLMGHPPNEIAALMGWSEPKTRNLLYRGLADLRTELVSLGYGPGAATT